MKTLRVLIVDDEPLARRRNSTMLRHIQGVEIAGEATDGDEAIRMIRELVPDVLLLDIEMPGMSGFECLTQLDPQTLPIVLFVTAFDHYAVKAFDVSAVDYLLKPVSFDRMHSAIARARNALATRDADSRMAEVTNVIAALRPEPEQQPAAPRYETEFWVPRRGEFVRVPASQIEWVEAERDYVRLHTRTTSLLLRETMASMEARLDPMQFLRVHRSAIVRQSLIGAIRQGGYGTIKLGLTTGVEVPIGRTYTASVRQLLSRRDLAA
ncbi:DNA-binding LytR/AlgR family response regulator [Novosphingobium chloroacetimidivorans]|uniref:DNA-binding LytR/AlgR family response regulator n=1 Tax=Novosphingobium chloroacetimidivorans TaxID=1428314 RepID=A0A7W7K651_9SPHN|nr:LytTR family DNA-binding domain-containing protein [Novosphingobium chloroacetimidivorans]MBB4856967.1 DNA-binding LytR/AlgR family response regulator [Novosphingobium chloroacetimidivorans]